MFLGFQQLRCEVHLPTSGDVVKVLNVPQIQRDIKLRGLSPHANYTDRAAAAGRRS